MKTNPQRFIPDCGSPRRDHGQKQVNGSAATPNKTAPLSGPHWTPYHTHYRMTQLRPSSAIFCIFEMYTWPKLYTVLVVRKCVGSDCVVDQTVLDHWSVVSDFGGTLQPSYPIV